MRRVVTGHDARGKAVFLSDGQPPRVLRLASFPGLEMTEVWRTAADAGVPAPSPDPTVVPAKWTPGPGETRLILTRFPTQAELESRPGGWDELAARAEYLASVPGDWNIEPGQMAMHTTDSVDYDVVLSGELWLELDDGAETRLGPGDVVVQNGTRHAWHNRSDQPCLMLSVLVGARRA